MNIFGKRASTVQLLEDVYAAPQRIDTEAGVIYGVRVLGKVSQNGREYSDAAMQQAAKLYEGVKVNVDHPLKSSAARAFIEGIGELRDVRQDSGAVVADLHYIKSHPYAGPLVEAAQRFPNQFGLSHNADGTTVQRRGKTIVESVVAVRSVDLVGRPATNAGLFESVSEEHPMTKTTIRALVESQANAVHKTRLTEMDGAEGAVMNEPVDVPMDANGDGAIDAAFKQMIMGVLDDEKLDIKGKQKRIGEILKAQDKLMNGGSAAAADAPAETPVAESLIVNEIRAMRLREECRDWITEAGREVTRERLTLLVEAKDDAARQKLIESWPAAGAATTTTVRKPAVNLTEQIAHRDRESKYVPGSLMKAITNRR